MFVCFVSVYFLSLFVMHRLRRSPAPVSVFTMVGFFYIHNGTNWSNLAEISQNVNIICLMRSTKSCRVFFNLGEEKKKSRVGIVPNCRERNPWAGSLTLHEMGVVINMGWS